MTLGAGGRAGARRRQIPTRGRALRPRTSSKSQRVVRAAVFATPAADQATLIAHYAHTNPAIVAGLDLVDDTRPVTGADAEAPLEEDDTPELLGQDGEQFDLDPDGDFSEDELPAVGHHRHAPDLIIEREEIDGAVRFIPALGPLPAVRVRQHPSAKPADLAAAGWILRAVNERARRLLEIGEIVVDRQRDFFLGESPNEALKGLKPLTAEEVARKIDIDPTAVGRLLEASEVETPNVGRVPLGIFFGPGARGVRIEALAAWIREIVATAPEKRWTLRDLRLELEKRGAIPSGGSKQATEKRIGRAWTEVLGTKRGAAWRLPR